MEPHPHLWKYLLLEQLTQVSECLQTIGNVSSSYGFVKQMEGVHNIATSLHNLWVNSFTQMHVITLKGVKVKLTEQLKIYTTKI